MEPPIFILLWKAVFHFPPPKREPIHPPKSPEMIVTQPITMLRSASCFALRILISSILTSIFDRRVKQAIFCFSRQSIFPFALSPVAFKVARVSMCSFTSFFDAMHPVDSSKEPIVCKIIFWIVCVSVIIITPLPLQYRTNSPHLIRPYTAIRFQMYP